MKLEAVHRSIRRVVTGHDAQGRSVIVQDQASPFVLEAAGGGPRVTDLWKTFGAPADNNTEAEPCSTVVLAPPRNGTIFRTVQFPPDGNYMDGWNEQAAFSGMGHKLESAPVQRGKPAGMHRTRSLDYALVLSGEIWAVMDEGETLLRAGDVLIQRGANHGWSNRSSEPALVAFVLIDAQELDLPTEGKSS